MAGLSTWWPGAARLRPEKLVKRILPRSLFGRALLIIITPVVVIQIVATYIFFERHWDQVSRRLALEIGRASCRERV